MLERSRGLSAAALQSIADLEARVVAHDGGRLKLEWGELRSRSGDRVDDLLWWHRDGRLDGFLGLYGFGERLELAGMVAPEARRQGIATALLDAALALCRERHREAPLLIVPRSSAGGRALARRRGGTLDHSEHSLVLADDAPALPPDARARPPTSAPSAPGDPRVTLRQATTGDLPRLARLLADGFGEPPRPAALAERLDDARGQTLVVERDGDTVGTLYLARDGEHVGIYGFVVDPPLQGRGIGRAALRQAVQRARSEGASRVSLQVSVDNERALGLYTSLGFAQVSTEDYYALATWPEGVAATGP